MGDRVQGFGVRIWGFILVWYAPFVFLQQFSLFPTEVELIKGPLGYTLSAMYGPFDLKCPQMVPKP